MWNGGKRLRGIWNWRRNVFKLVKLVARKYLNGQLRIGTKWITMFGLVKTRVFSSSWRTFVHFETGYCTAGVRNGVNWRPFILRLTRRGKTTQFWWIFYDSKSIATRTSITDDIQECEVMSRERWKFNGVKLKLRAGRLIELPCPISSSYQRVAINTLVLWC